MIQISQPILGDDVEAEVLEVIRSGQLAQGPKVIELERLFCELTGCRHAVAVTSGTTALELSLALLELRPGDEVLTTPFTFAATLNAIIHTGATACFVDVDDDGLMNLELAREQITARTRALLPVHLYGLPVDLARFDPPEGLVIVEDAAQAIGARIGDRAAGSFGLGCFSLYATKNVTTGEGGVVTTDDADMASRARVIRNQGMRERYEYVVPGHNYRMTDLQAAVGLPQLRRLEEINLARSENAERLRTGLANLAGLRVPAERPGRTHAWHQFTIWLTGESAVNRDSLGRLLREKGVATGVYYPRPVFDYLCYRNHPQVRIEPVPRAEAMAGQVLSLPVHPGLTRADIDHIVSEVRNAFGD
ncbi:MAG TPA: DegT/DnrJ/EryC1/StrS family aminotransferase [Acidimicrobiia bacterium]|nr:DegT/DnrJ/EryC1/StrS family aminotransferase [Acidimicrobiia bacterium]